MNLRVKGHCAQHCTHYNAQRPLAHASCKQNRHTTRATDVPVNVTVKGTVAARENGGPTVRSTLVAVVLLPTICSDGTVDASNCGATPEAKKAEGYKRRMVPPGAMAVLGVNASVTATFLLPCAGVRRCGCQAQKNTNSRQSGRLVRLQKKRR